MENTAMGEAIAAKTGWGNIANIPIEEAAEEPEITEEAPEAEEEESLTEYGPHLLPIMTDSRNYLRLETRGVAISDTIFEEEEIVQPEDRHARTVPPHPEKPLKLPVTMDTVTIGDTSGMYHGVTIQAAAVQVTMPDEPADETRQETMEEILAREKELYARTKGYRTDEDIWHQRMGHPSIEVLNNCINANYRPHTARTGKFEDRARWGIHLGIESEYHAWTILDFATHQLTRSRDCIFYERLTLPLYRQHRAARNAPDNIFQGQHSFANDEDDVDVAGEQPTKPAADMADEATFIPVTEQFGTPAYFPTNIDPHEAVQAQHNYASAEMHSPMNEDSTYDSSRDTFRDIPGDDDGVVEVTTTAETNLTGLRILGLAVAVRSNQ
ncbi:unnamed protein product [Closterium sp. NIES-54]